MRFEHVIVGGSAAGVGCIEAIREIDSSAEILLISAEKQIYSRALIPYYLKGKIGTKELLYRGEEFLEKNNVTAKLGVRVLEIDVGKKAIKLDNGESVEYEKLLLATGGKPIIPKIEGLQGQENVFTFHSEEDVFGIEKALKNAKKAVVLGGGIIGLMLAEALSERGLEVKVVELADRVLSAAVDAVTSQIIQRKFAEKGVEIILGNTVVRVEGEKRVESVILRDGRRLETDIFAVAIGVTPNVELAKNAGIRVNRGIVVNRKMETSAKDVYAAGDCAELFDTITNTIRPLPLWITAYMGGRIAGFNMCGFARELEFATAMNAMHFFDYYVITAGLNVEAQEFEVISKLEGENYKRFTLKDGKIVGFIIAGKTERAGIFLKLMREGVDVGEFKQSLLRENFGFLSIPEHLRWKLLGDKVKLGVVRDEG